MAKMSNGFYQAVLNALVKSGDAALTLAFQHEMIHQRLLDQQEREQLIEETASRVIDRIRGTVDVTDIVNQIDELNKAIDRLGKNK